MSLVVASILSWGIALDKDILGYVWFLFEEMFLLCYDIKGEGSCSYIFFRKILGGSSEINFVTSSGKKWIYGCICWEEICSKVPTYYVC